MNAYHVCVCVWLTARASDCGRHTLNVQVHVHALALLFVRLFVFPQIFFFSFPFFSLLCPLLDRGLCALAHSMK